MSLNSYVESEMFPDYQLCFVTPLYLVHEQGLTNRPCARHQNPERVCIITTDGRNLVGVLSAHDHTTNLVRRPFPTDLLPTGTGTEH
jgi:hypothetical protein